MVPKCLWGAPKTLQANALCRPTARAISAAAGAPSGPGLRFAQPVSAADCKSVPASANDCATAVICLFVCADYFGNGLIYGSRNFHASLRPLAAMRIRVKAALSANSQQSDITARICCGGGISGPHLIGADGHSSSSV